MNRGTRRALPGPAGARHQPGPPRPPLQHDSAPARALHRAWLSEFGAEPPFRLVDELARARWDPAALGRLAAVVDTAQATRTAPTGPGPAGPGPTGPAGGRSAAAVLLARTAATLALMAPLTVAETLDWLRVLAGEPVWRDVHRPGGLVYAAPGQVRPLEAWRASVPHRLAVLSHAAGLTPTEAAAQFRSGGLDEADLRVLAALRGAAQP